MTKAQEWKERRSNELKELILDAAAGVFNKKGFERTTTREISKAAGVSEGTIYNYFENKRDLLLMLVRRFAEDAISLFPEGAAEPETGPDGARFDPEAFTARYFLERLLLFREGLSPTLIFYYAKRDPEVKTIIDSMVARSMDDMLRPPLEKLRKSGLIKDMSTDFLVRFMQTIVFGLAVMLDLESADVGRKHSIEEMSVMARDVIWYGVARGEHEQQQT